MSDAVEHPAHYGGEDNPYEVIKVAEKWGFDQDAYLFNVLKYIARPGKGNYLEDLKKAKFYLERRIALMEEAVKEARPRTVPCDHGFFFACAECAASAYTSSYAIARSANRALLPKVNSHWILKAPDKDWPRCRVVVSSLRSGLIETTTIAIEGQPVPLYSIIKSTYNYDQFFREMIPWDAAATNPWDAEDNAVNRGDFREFPSCSGLGH